MVKATIRSKEDREGYDQISGNAMSSGQKWQAKDIGNTFCCQSMNCNVQAVFKEEMS